MSRLWVWYSSQLIGQIVQTSEGLSFTYDREWARHPKAFPLSKSLPIIAATYEKEATTFFGNLLPEGSARESLCRRFGISVENDFELLARIGEDCAGAFVVTNSPKPPAETGGVEEIPHAQLATWLKDDSAGILDLQVKGDLRLSLAGAQNKLPLIYKEGRFYKPLGNQPTTHILKPAPKGFRNLPQNEWINGRLYAEFGIATASSELVKLGLKYALVVERYDRMKANESWVRLHQEDFCQALAISYRKKYEQEGGPSLLNCQELIDMRSDDPAADIDALLRWQILNVLVGNCDGHGKNLSLLRNHDGQWRLAPFYDLVATTGYRSLTKKLAMSVGGQFHSTTIHPKHWRAQFEGARVSPTEYMKIVNEFVGLMPDKLGQVLKEFSERYGAASFLAEYKAHQLKIVRRNRQLIALDRR